MQDHGQISKNILLSQKIGAYHDVKQRKRQTGAETGKDLLCQQIEHSLSEEGTLSFITILNKVYVIYCRDSQRFLPAFY